jgi:hypothetical protein
MSIIGKPYNLKACTLVIGGLPIGGFDEDGGVNHEQLSDIVEAVVGADGETVFSRVNNDDVVATITVLPQSLGYKRLATLLNAQQILFRTGAPIVPLSYIFVDPSNGDSVTAAYVVFLNRPSMPKNRKVEGVEFRLHLVSPAQTNGITTTV